MRIPTCVLFTNHCGRRGLCAILGEPELKLQAKVVSRYKPAVNHFACHLNAKLPCVFVHGAYVDNNAGASFVTIVCFV